MYQRARACQDFCTTTCGQNTLAAVPRRFWVCVMYSGHLLLKTDVNWISSYKLGTRYLHVVVVHMGLEFVYRCSDHLQCEKGEKTCQLKIKIICTKYIFSPRANLFFILKSFRRPCPHAYVYLLSLFTKHKILSWIQSLKEFRILICCSAQKTSGSPKSLSSTRPKKNFWVV